MEPSELTYAYRSEAGGLKLLGILSIVMCPLVLWMTFQDSGSEEALIGGLWIRGPVVPWIMRAFGVILLIIGVAMFKGGSSLAKGKSTIELSGESMQLFGKKTILYSSITGLRHAGERLTLTTKDGDLVLLASQMESKEKFDELSAQLASRVAR